MPVKVSDIEYKNILQLQELSQAFTSKVKPDKTGFVQNRIFLLIINKICASITTPHFLSFSQQQSFVFFEF